MAPDGSGVGLSSYFGISGALSVLASWSSLAMTAAPRLPSEVWINRVYVSWHIQLHADRLNIKLLLKFNKDLISVVSLQEV